MSGVTANTPTAGIPRRYHLRECVGRDGVAEVYGSERLL